MNKNCVKNRLDCFPIGVWVPTYPDYMNRKELAEMREAGINFIPSLTRKRRELELIREAGLKCIVNDTRVSYADITGISKVQKWVREYCFLPQVIGVFVWDEPSPLMMRICGAINSEAQRVSEDIVGYINLHPSYSDRALQRCGMTYEQYLQYFVDTCAPRVISFDHYPFLEGGITEDYFYNLAAVRACCNRNGLEFWSFVQTCSFSQNVTPGEAQILWQVNTNLAYGARGLLYFTYWTVTHDREVSFGPALVLPDGRKTERYYFVQRINATVAADADRLLHYEHRGVMFFDSPERGTAQGYAGLNSAEGGALLAGCFENENGGLALYLVNLDWECEREFTLTFGDRTERVTLAAGGAKLMERGV